MKWSGVGSPAPRRSTNAQALESALGERVNQVLEFERFYVRHLNKAAAELCVREINVAEAAVLHELIDWPRTPAWLAWHFGLDRGYISRTLAYLAACGFIEMRPRKEDRREREITLTRCGKMAASDLKQFQEDRVRKMLEELPSWQQKRLARSMRAILEIFRRDDYTNFVEKLAAGES